MKLFLAQPRGFCAGVSRAIETLQKVVDKYPQRIYVRHPIVHNEHVVARFEKQGVNFISEIDEVPDNAILVLSAHGSSLQVHEQVKARGLKYIDAVCPLVQKIHDQAKDYHEQGYTIILLGKKGHQEILGTMSRAPMHLIGNLDDAKRLEVDGKILLITQTTLSVDETQEVANYLKEKYPGIIVKNDICYATDNRQNAVKQLSKECDVMIIVGSQLSNNTKGLLKQAKKNCEAYMVSDASSFRKDWIEGKDVVGISSGASVPEELVQELLQKIGIDAKTIIYKEENISFSLPHI